MRIAVIGGGASGLVTAYLLHRSHHIHIFEKDNVLGGNIRTLNGNVSPTRSDPDLKLENGVLGFHMESYPNFHRLMRHLDVQLYMQNCSAGLYSRGRHLPASQKEVRKRLSIWKRPAEFMKALGVARDQKKFWKNLSNQNVSDLESLSFRSFSPGNNAFRDFIHGILMISFSSPYRVVGDLPAALTVPFLNYLSSTSRWSFVEGGVYTYVEKMMRNFRGEISLDVSIESVMRKADKVTLKLSTKDLLEFDKVVIATTPGAVLELLDDPTEREKEIFQKWTDRKFQTVLHNDGRLYRPYGNTYRTPMDVFVEDAIVQPGYNTYLNEVYRIGGRRHYSFAYGLEDMIDRDAIIHNQEHTVPVYTSEAYATRDLIEGINGLNGTYYAGAYLGNALHEGAVTSAMNVAKSLGGLEV